MQGGLGNQLFQICFGLTLKEKYPKERILLYFGLATREGYFYSELVHLLSKSDKFFLLCSNVKYKRACVSLSGMVEKVSRSKILGKFLSNEEFREKKYREDISNKRKRIFRGYFQDAEVVAAVKQEIKSLMEPTLERLAKELTNKLGLPSSFGIVHLRAGDYYTREGHKLGVLGEKYFLAATQKVSGLPLILLTENENQVNKLLNRIQFNYVLDKSKCSALEAIALISRSEFFVGSNSTLSWWGAWFANHDLPTYMPNSWDPKGTSLSDLGLHQDKFTYCEPFWK